MNLPLLRSAFACWDTRAYGIGFTTRYLGNLHINWRALSKSRIAYNTPLLLHLRKQLCPLLYLPCRILNNNKVFHSLRSCRLPYPRTPNSSRQRFTVQLFICADYEHIQAVCVLCGYRWPCACKNPAAERYPFRPCASVPL